MMDMAAIHRLSARVLTHVLLLLSKDHIKYIISLRYINSKSMFYDFNNLNYLPGAMGNGAGTGAGNMGIASEAVTAKLKIVNMTNFMFLSCFSISVG